jgi:hypothetical protein
VKSLVKGAAVGFVWFLAYSAVAKFVVQPAAAKYGVPVLKDL